MCCSKFNAQTNALQVNCQHLPYKDEEVNEIPPELYTEGRKGNRKSLHPPLQNYHAQALGEALQPYHRTLEATWKGQREVYSHNAAQRCLGVSSSPASAASEEKRITDKDVNSKGPKPKCRSLAVLKD